MSSIRTRRGQANCEAGTPPGRNLQGCRRCVGALMCRKRSFATHADQLRPRLEDRRLPVAGPAARRLRASTTRPTSTTTSFPASATTGRDSTAACAPARLGRNLAHLVNTVATWSRTRSRPPMRGRTCSSGGGHLMEDWGAYLTGQRGLRPCPNPDWPTSCATLQFNTIRATRPDGPWPRGAATDGQLGRRDCGAVGSGGIWIGGEDDWCSPEDPNEHSRGVRVAEEIVRPVGASCSGTRERSRARQFNTVGRLMPRVVAM